MKKANELENSVLAEVQEGTVAINDSSMFVQIETEKEMLSRVRYGEQLEALINSRGEKAKKLAKDRAYVNRFNNTYSLSIREECKMQIRFGFLPLIMVTEYDGSGSCSGSDEVVTTESNAVLQGFRQFDITKKLLSQDAKLKEKMQIRCKALGVCSSTTISRMCKGSTVSEFMFSNVMAAIGLKMDISLVPMTYNVLTRKVKAYLTDVRSGGMSDEAWDYMKDLLRDEPVFAEMEKAAAEKAKEDQIKRKAAETEVDFIKEKLSNISFANKQRETSIEEVLESLPVALRSTFLKTSLTHIGTMLKIAEQDLLYVIRPTNSSTKTQIAGKAEKKVRGDKAVIEAVLKHTFGEFWEDSTGAKLKRVLNGKQQLTLGALAQLAKDHLVEIKVIL